MRPPTEPLFDLPEPRRSTVARAQWVLAALDPAPRRHHIERYLDPWVTWLVHTYRLRTVIPPCWYRHPDITERLKNLMAAWIATFTDDPGDHLTDRPFAYVEFDDALERQLHRISVPPACLDGDHQEPPTTWTTDAGQAAWLASSEWATAAAAHPTPDFTGQPTAARTEPAMTNPSSQPGPSRQPGPAENDGFVMPRAHGEGLVKDGLAQAMRDYAIHYDGAWWLGDQTTYVRVTDPEFNRKLDFKAIKLARADEAVARAHQPENTDEPGKGPSGDQPAPGNQPDAAGERSAAAAEVRPEPYDRPGDRPDDPGEVS